MPAVVGAWVALWLAGDDGRAGPAAAERCVADRLPSTRVYGFVDARGRVTGRAGGLATTATAGRGEVDAATWR